MNFYKAKDGNTYDMEELIDMLKGKDSKYKDFFKNLSEGFCDSLPLDVQVELVDYSICTALNNSLRHKNEFVSIFYLLNQGKL